MGEQARGAVDIRNFEGMASNADPADIKPGISQVQVNVNGLKTGQLEVRRGLRPLQFDEE